ncbi:MAG: CDP-alcohol phosphatidyltransferase family protein [Candidatus Omnitrophota bacterium]
MFKEYAKTFYLIKEKYNVNKKKQFDKREIQSYFVFRPLSFIITPFFVMLKISANIVTLLSFVFLLLSGFFILKGFDYFLLSIIFIFFAFLFDYVDGNLARYSGTTNYFGKFIDGVCGVIGMFFVQFCLVIYLFKKMSFYPQVFLLCLFFLELIVYVFTSKYVILSKEITSKDHSDLVGKGRNVKGKNSIIFCLINIYMQFKNIIFFIVVFFMSIAHEPLAYLYFYGSYLMGWVFLSIAKIFYKVRGWDKIHRAF